MPRIEDYTEKTVLADDDLYLIADSEDPDGSLNLTTKGVKSENLKAGSLKNENEVLGAVSKVKLWLGTEAEFDDITIYEDDTVYIYEEVV